MQDTENRQTRPSGEWELRQPYGWKTVAGLLAIMIVLAVSARHTDMYKGLGLIAEGGAEAVGLVEESDVGEGWKQFIRRAFPFVFAEKTELSRIQNFDRENMPWFAYIEEESLREYDIDAGEWVKTDKIQYLVVPGGYLFRVLRLMLETFEIAIWGTILSVLISLPLAYFGSKGYSPHSVLYNLSRAVCSFNRAIPELISAMFLVLMFGFGSFPGVLALGIHTSGFLGKFFADDIENTEKGPQEALRSTGANKLKVLRYAVLPQVLPQYLAYLQYILERNVRTATVLGIVGAGGIGMELKGRWDLYDYGHVSTILLVIFITVFLLEHLTQYMRGKVIR